MSKYKLIQLTNNAISDVAADSLVPLGLITRRVNSTTNNCATFNIASSTSDTVYINEPGYYEIKYSASYSAAATGNFEVSLLTNQQTVMTATETVAAADDYVNINMSYVIRVCPNCCSAPYNCPVAVQIKLGDIASSATQLSVANLIIEKVY